jgi:hypothetical protein
MSLYAMSFITITLVVIIIILNISHEIKENFDSSSELENAIKTAAPAIKEIKKISRVVDEILLKAHLDYWIEGGTLLGAVRHHDVIPWDDDFDIGIKAVDEKRFLTLEKQFNEQGYQISKFFAGYKIFAKTGKETKYEWKYPFCDVFLFDYDPKKEMYIYKNKTAQKMWPNSYFSSSELFPLKQYRIGKHYSPGPNKSYSYLDRVYGKDWPVTGYQQYDHKNEKALVRNKFIASHKVGTLPYLWVYWDNIDGKKTPEYIKLCRETMWKHCQKDFIIMELDKDKILTFLPELLSKNRIKHQANLKIQHKVDYYRILLLKKYGGLYLDADTIVLRSPIEIINRLKKHDFVGFGCTGNLCTYGYGNPSNGVMASRPNGKLISEVNDVIVYQMNNNKVGHKWGYFDFGKKLIWEAISKLGKKGYKYYHYSNHYDGTRDRHGKWVVTKRIFGTETIDYRSPDKMMFLILYNSGMDEIRHMTREKLMNDSNESETMQITKFLKKSLT